MKQLFLSVLLAMGTVVAVCAQQPLAGKRIGVLGDSYVRNHREPMENTWHYKFAQRQGMQYYNYGRNGNCISIDLNRWGKAMVNRYQEMNDSLDYIVVIAGHNDATRLDSIGVDLFREKLTDLCDGLIDRYPRAQLFFFTPWMRADNDVNAHNFEAVVDCMRRSVSQRAAPMEQAVHYRHSVLAAHADNGYAAYTKRCAYGANSFVHRIGKIYMNGALFSACGSAKFSGIVPSSIRANCR